MDRHEMYKVWRDTSAVDLKKKHFHQFNREFEQTSATNSTMSVLEIGCGTGIFLRYLEQKGYSRIVAIDTDEGLKPVLSDLTKTQVYIGDVFAIAAQNFPGDRFDRIVLFDVIEHIDVTVIFDFFRRLHDLLAPGGKIVIRAPNLTSPWGVKMFFDTFDHVTPITPGRIRELAQITGYTVDGIYPQVLGKLKTRIAQSVLHSFLSAALPYRPDIWSANLLAVLSRDTTPIA